VERLGVGGDHRRHQPDVLREGGRPRRDQRGVEPAADLVGPRVGPAEAAGLQAESVLDGDEVEQAALGLLDESHPVPGREQLSRAGARLAPGGRMPASALERDGQVNEPGRGRERQRIGGQDALP
jgi:hypothetical protein